MFPRRLGISLALAVCLGAAAYFAVLAGARDPGAGWQARNIFIPKGTGYPEIFRMLQDARLLRHPVVFRALVLGTATGRHLQSGEYAFPAPPSAFEVWSKLVRGDVARYNVTIPEGSNIYDIAAILGDSGLADPEAFVDAARSRELAARLDVPADTVEGFLFPDTYVLVKYMPEEEIIGVMVRQFRRRFTPDMEAKARDAGFSLRQIVTIASIIEKETGVAGEKPLISAVIRRRLALGMPLQMDPTVIYGLRKFGEALTRKDLRTPNPYNTYLRRGLPPGPIANPGLASLLAAVNPADADYLYFVARNDGSHEFSRSLADHNRAVAAFRKSTSAAN
ncbi:MAG: endolytic transglycosylase MltG [Gemmatimonadota bacterium]